MSDIPNEYLGVPIGLVIIFVVSQLENAGFVVNRYAGLVAILIATLVGSLDLTLIAQQPWPLAVFKGIIWGVFIIYTHYAVISPIKNG